MPTISNLLGLSDMGAPTSLGALALPASRPAPVPRLLQAMRQSQPQPAAEYRNPFSLPPVQPPPYAPYVLPEGLMWRFVEARFRCLLDRLALPEGDASTGISKARRIIECLDRHFYAPGSSRQVQLIGSWGKDTTTRPKSDVDILYELPLNLRYAYALKQGNVQSALLQEVRGALLKTFPLSEISSRGPVVVVNHQSYKVEILPAFPFVPGFYEVPATRDGGSYEIVSPGSEVGLLSAVDRDANGNARPLIRLLKHWARVKKIPLKSIHLELLALDFLCQWRFRRESLYYADWMVRDAFRHIAECGYTQLTIPSTRKVLPLPGGWLQEARKAHAVACRASEYEAASRCYDAGTAWQEVFGSWIPKT